MGIFSFISIALREFSHRDSPVIYLINRGAIAVIALHPLLIQYTRRLLLFLGFDWNNRTLIINIVISAAIMNAIYMVIPFFERYAPIMIGQKNK